MALTVGDIELDRVQVVRTRESQSIVKHRIPGSVQTVFQDLGRLPVTILAEGIMQGPTGLENLETLRQTLRSGKPVLFSSSAATPLDVDQVIVEDLKVEEFGGRPRLYRYVLELTEVVEAPSDVTDAGALTDMNADILEEAGGFIEGLEDGLAAKAALERLSPKIQRLGELVKKLGGT